MVPIQNASQGNPWILVQILWSDVFLLPPNDKVEASEFLCLALSAREVYLPQLYMGCHIRLPILDIFFVLSGM